MQEVCKHVNQQIVTAPGIWLQFVEEHGEVCASLERFVDPAFFSMKNLAHYVELVWK